MNSIHADMLKAWRVSESAGATKWRPQPGMPAVDRLCLQHGGPGLRVLTSLQQQPGQFAKRYQPLRAVGRIAGFAVARQQLAQHGKCFVGHSRG